MDLSRSSLLGILLVSWALLLTSCASEPPAGPAGPSPDVRLGPVLDLLRFKTTRDQVDTLLDHQGYAHVLIAAASTKEVHHVVVSPEGAVKLELVEANASPSAVSAAFDSDAKLHLLLDDRHLLREKSAWKSTHNTPWEAAGIKAGGTRLVQGKNGLLWTFLVGGKEVGAKGRWDWFGIGGFGGGIIFPWLSESEKLVIVPEAAMAKPLWYVLDPQDNLDTSPTMIAIDHKENLHVVYYASRSVIAESRERRYAQIKLTPPEPLEANGTPGNPNNNKQLYPVSGIQIPLPLINLVQGGSFALDAASGTVFMVLQDSSYALTHGQWSAPLRLPRLLPQFFSAKLAAAGGDAFHLMTIADSNVQYLQYAQGGWSAPVQLGRAEVGWWTGSMLGSSDIASNGHNRAFVVWPTENGLVGRWVEGAREFQPLPDVDIIDSRTSAKSIPKHLTGFANGKAELITPGWVSGLAEAVAAGTNSQLTKRLHASGQWESLATVVLKDNYGDDVRWYYLGRAAEGMSLCEAAENYYRISQESSKHLVTRCLGIACNGINLPDILEERLIAVGAIRSAEKCLAPPVTNQ